eukprot:CAMPEP_0115596864 /NCGR_PEP_ID=MMETSP0272-20121206/13054_1 /TAXON_ID=71861 /ORGANISM="Scrippsiella trochoidea, Strain CCMP3099" /LENGTH=99 /DNA_ID=CAMNT_0003032213 /DNA_START=788 /DNA_END=1085 /DNA_ORIENTATION=+
MSASAGDLRGALREEATPQVEAALEADQQLLLILWRVAPSGLLRLAITDANLSHQLLALTGGKYGSPAGAITHAAASERAHRSEALPPELGNFLESHVQ